MQGRDSGRHVRQFRVVEPGDFALHFAEFQKSAPQILSRREREVFVLAALGKDRRETAEALGISVRTVETHRRAIRQKLGVNRDATLALYAIRNALIVAEESDSELESECEVKSASTFWTSSQN
jgi:DNA-binding CsgD family transcriptional regulator